LLRRNLLPQAQELERQAREGIGAVREGVEEASRSVLGDEEESLRLAREQLDEAIRQVNEETARSDSEGSQRQQDGQPGTEGRPQDRQAGMEGRPQERQASAGRPQESPEGQRQDQGQRQGQGQRAGEAQQDQQGSPRGGRRPRPEDLRTAQAGERGQRDPAGWGGGGPDQSGSWEDIGARGPLTGADFREWSDRLRDVEEALTERELREEVARVRDRARAVRAEFVRHGTEPQWDLVRTQIMAPLNELRQQISERLAQLQSDEALVPIDRDPVPDRYAEVVRRYFENLGGGD
jgi:hypothetical protein